MTFGTTHIINLCVFKALSDFTTHLQKRFVYFIEVRCARIPLKLVLNIWFLALLIRNEVRYEQQQK